MEGIHHPALCRKESKAFLNIGIDLYRLQEILCWYRYSPGRNPSQMSEQSPFPNQSGRKSNSPGWQPDLFFHGLLELYHETNVIFSKQELRKVKDC